METLEKLLKKAAKEENPKKKRALFEEALTLQPDCLEALKGLLLLGRLGARGTQFGDVTAVRSYCLNVFDQPENYDPQAAAEIIREMTEGEALQACLKVCPDRDSFIKEYVKHICGEYVRVFMDGDNHRNGTLMGIRLGNHGKRMAGYAADMLREVKASSLPAPFDIMLPEALMDAFDRCWDNQDLIEQELQ